MKIRLIALTVLMCPAAAAAAEGGFATDLGSFKESAARVEVPAPSRTHNGNKYFSRDCASLELGAGEGAVESEKAELYSQEFIEECKPLPPNELGLIIEHCYSRPLREWCRGAKLLVKPREIPPGKKEVFEVCLEGEKLELKPLSVFYIYKAVNDEEENATFTLTPLSAAPKELTAGGPVKL